MGLSDGQISPGGVSSHQAQIQLPNTPEELAMALSLLLAPDNDKINQGTLIMKHYLKQPTCVPAMMHMITQCDQAGVRQMVRKYSEAEKVGEKGAESKGCGR